MEEKNPFILQGNWNNFLTLQNEVLLIVKRKHSFLLIGPIVFILLLGSIFIIVDFYLFTQIIGSMRLFLSSFLTLCIIALSLLVKIYIDWYLHLYVVTNRKILEIRYAPLNAHILNSVLLDQVNCTEIDIRTNGFINQLIDMGNVVMTFDRPTHEEEFCFAEISDSRKIGAYLSDNLVNTRRQDMYMPVWYRPKTEKKYKFMEEVFPNPAI